MSSNLEFFKNLQVTQGSLELKTVDEIKIINEFGQLIIGNKASQKICQSPAEVITVIVPASSTRMHPPKEYTYQQLQDLISLIVLISGKSKAENQSRMQRFLEVSKYTKCMDTNLRCYKQFVF